MPEAKSARNLQWKNSDAAAPRPTSTARETQSQRSPQLDASYEDREEDPAPSSAASPKFRRPKTGIPRHLATGAMARVVTVRQLGPGCRGGPLSLEAGRRLPEPRRPRGPQVPHLLQEPGLGRLHRAPSAPSSPPAQVKVPACQKTRHGATGVVDRTCQHQTVWSDLSGRLAVIQGGSPSPEDREEPRTVILDHGDYGRALQCPHRTTLVVLYHQRKNFPRRSPGRASYQAKPAKKSSPGAVPVERHIKQNRRRGLPPAPSRSSVVSNDTGEKSSPGAVPVERHIKQNRLAISP